jgi:hypothetical protein
LIRRKGGALNGEKAGEPAGQRLPFSKPKKTKMLKQTLNPIKYHEIYG